MVKIELYTDEERKKERKKIWKDLADKIHYHDVEGRSYEELISYIRNMDITLNNKDRNGVSPVQRYRIHFNECWDEDFYLSEEELKEWLGEIVDIINDDNLRINEKMQRVVDSVV